MNRIIILITALILLASCEFTAPDRYEENKLVIAGYLKSGEPVTLDNAIFVGKTISVEGESFEEILITDAEVNLIDVAEADTFMMGFGIDINEDGSMIFGYYNQFIEIEPQKTYRIEVSAVVDSQEVFAWAETTTPKALNINMDYYENSQENYGFSEELIPNLPQVPYEDVDKEFPIYLNMDSGDVVYTNYKFYCLEEFSTDLEWTEPFADFTHLDEENEDEYNSVMGNNLREASMSWRYQPQQDENGNWFLMDDYYKGGFRFYGAWRLNVYVVDVNYYTYIYHSENYLHGGIHGGIGYFGSVSGEDFYIDIIK